MFASLSSSLSSGTGVVSLLFDDGRVVVASAKPELWALRSPASSTSTHTPRGGVMHEEEDAAMPPATKELVFPSHDPPLMQTWTGEGR